MAGPPFGDDCNDGDCSIGGGCTVCDYNGSCEFSETNGNCPSDCGEDPPPSEDPPPPPPPEPEAELHIYADESYDGNQINVFAAAEVDSAEQGQVQLDVTLTDEETGQQVGGGSASGYPSASLDTSAPYPGPGEEFDVEAQDGGTGVVLLIVAKWVLPNIISKIKDWFAKLHFGTSILCYDFFSETPGDLGTFCEYKLTPICNVTCGPVWPGFAVLKTSSVPVCQPRMQVNGHWSRKGSGAPKCGFATHYANPGCICIDLKVK